MTQQTQQPWWKGAVIYQIYPRSFMDSNGDGIGDLVGITEKLPYIAGLGVDAIWISPFLKSPQEDFGYDVSDYRAIDPMFGTEEDFKTLVDTAHKLGLKVLMDMVLSHTSSQHVWFQESAQSKDNPKSDWYVWADPKPDGSPPNNWINRFTHSSAWEWEPRRRQYYLHNFLKSQPDLNYHNPEVVQEALDTCRFWLEKGVDGFRFDVINFLMHDDQLRDNPPMTPDQPNYDDLTAGNPLSYQRQLYNRTRPENLAFIEKLREVLNEFPHVTSIGEVSDDDHLRVAAEYTTGDKRLHMAYNFYLLRDIPFSVGLVKEALALTDHYFGKTSWPMWTSGNHDCMRLATRWGGHTPDPRLIRVALAMLGSFRGTMLLYQGDELGLPEADIPYALLQDPYGIAMWPDYKGRDGCRTPMPWEAGAENAGFSYAVPWLPVPEVHHPLAVDQQVGHERSVLESTKLFLNWRKTQPALLYGDIETLTQMPEGIVGVRREYEGKQVYALFNLTDAPQVCQLPEAVEILHGHGLTGDTHVNGKTVTLSPYSAFYGAV